MTYTDTEGLVPVVPPVLEIGPVFELFLRRQLEDFLSNGELAVDLFLGESEIGYVEETLSI